MVENLHSVPYNKPPYSTRYPTLLNLEADFALGPDHVLQRALPKDNLIRRNVSWGGKFLDVGPLAGREHVRVEENLIADDDLFSGSFMGATARERPTPTATPRGMPSSKHGATSSSGEIRVLADWLPWTFSWRPIPTPTRSVLSRFPSTRWDCESTNIAGHCRFVWRHQSFHLTHMCSATSSRFRSPPPRCPADRRQ